MKKLSLVAAITASMLIPSQMEAQQMPQLPLDTAVVFGKLPNGLTYYVRHNEEPRNRVYFYIAQRVGSVQEEEEQRGLAHFLEHMCFNGTKHFPGDSIVKYCESIGVKFGNNLNAYTSTDETVYNIDDVPVTDGNIDSCLLILRDWSDGLLLLPDEIEKERGVIHEEWRMRTSAQMRILNRNLETLYPNSRYGKRMPIGLMSVVDNFAPQTLRDYYEKWYRPDLQGIIVVGDIDAKDIEKRIQKLFGDVEMPENPAEFKRFDVPATPEPIYVIDKDKEMQRTIIEVAYKTPAIPYEMANTTTTYMLSFVRNIIEISLNARLSELARKDDCPFAVAECYFDNYLLAKTEDCFIGAVIPKEGRDKEAVALLMQEIERARRFGITGTEAFRARQEILSSVERSYDNRDKQYSSYYVNKAVRHFLSNKPYPGIATEYELYKTFDQQIPVEICSQLMAQAAASIDTNFVFLAMYPDKEGLELPAVDDMKKIITDARKAELEPYVDNVKDEPLIAQLPKKGKITKEQPSDFGYTVWTLSNGARVFFKQTDFSNTEVRLLGLSWGGNATITDPAMLPTIKTFNSVISSTGLGNFTTTELQKKLAGKQVGLRPQLSTYQEYLSGSSTPKDLRTLFELIYMRFQEPANDVDGFNSCIARLRTSLENAAKEPMNAFNDSINATIYDHNPRQMDIKLEDLDKVKYEDVRRIYSERFKSAGDFDFIFTGAFNTDSLRLYVEQYIASLPGVKKREPRATEQIETYHQGSTENRFVRQMETPQAWFYQFWHGAHQYNLKEAVTASAYGSILRQRYTKTIREEKGFAYSVSASAALGRGVKDGLSVEIYCPFTPAKCDSVVMLVRQSIDDIAANGVTSEELTSFKLFQQKQYDNNQRQNGYWAGLMEDKIEWDIDGQTEFVSILEKLSSDDIRNYVKDVVLKANNCITIIMLPEDFTEKELHER
ncbi:MAG: insulinase family protein [Salinivirgaceae bacterium]|nr:insulinase family protein [Salinivirgaceae bacterium]